MLKMPWTFGVPAIAAACMLVCVEGHAQTAPLLDVTHSVAVSTQAVPVDESFTITETGTYQVTLTDFGAQIGAPLASAQLAVSFNNAIVGTPLTSTSGTSPWSTTFTAAATGTYMLHVVGTPGTGPGSGLIGINVTSTTDSTQTFPFSANLALPSSGAASLVGYMSDTFQVPASGTYQITLTDMQLPAALTTLTAGISNPTNPSNSLVTTVSADTGANTQTVTVTATLQSGVAYEIFAGGQASTSVGAGLYGVNVSGGGAVIYSRTVPVGSTTLINSPTLAAGSYTLGVTDLTYPTALTQEGAAVTLNGQAVSALSAAGTGTAFAVSASAAYQVFAVGTPASNSQGSYALTLTPSSGAPVISVARGVSDPASSVVAYSYDTSIVTPETYEFNLADFGYPSNLTAVSAIAVQAGARLGTALTSAGQTSVTPVTGPMSLLVFAQPAATASSNGVAGGLFGLDLQASGAATPAFQTSQGVGNLFSVQTVTIPSGGFYQAQVTDLKFPAAFANLSVIVTQGITLVGENFGGTLTFNATSGDYLVSLVTTPDPTAGAGTYSLVVGAAPASASVSLQAAATTVTAGATTTLKYTISGVTSCAATSSPSGVWSQSGITTSGSFTTPALTSTTTFTLTCTGDDGSTVPQSVTVNVTPATSTGSGSKNGGGSIGTDLLALLFGALVLRLTGRAGLTPDMRRIH